MYIKYLFYRNNALAKLTYEIIFLMQCFIWYTFFSIWNRGLGGKYGFPLPT